MKPLKAVCVLTCSALLWFFASSSLLWGQLPTATLNGIVTDPQAAVVAGAKVTLTHLATGVKRETTTGSDGQYVFTAVPPGDYMLRVEGSGFAPREYKDLRLEVGRVVTVDAKLALGQLGQVITVSEATPGVELTQSTVQGQITSTTVENLPLNGRNFLELAYLLPGNRSATNFDPTKTNTLEVSSAGQFGRGGNINVDGGDNNDEVVGGTLSNSPQDGIKEFQIATNRFTAEVGRSGSSIINIITKSGTNEYHGSGFIFVRNRNLQGLPATFDRTQPTPPFDRQQYGGSVGGPIQRDRAWFFASAENRHQNAAVQTGTRNFAQQRVINTSASAPLRDVLVTGRSDIKLSANDTLAGRYSFNRSDETDNGSLRRPSGTAANRQDSLNKFHSVLGEWTRTVSASQVNSLIFHFDWFLNSIPAFPNSSPTLNPSTLPPVAAGNEIRFPDLQDGGNFRIPQRTRFKRYQLKDTFAWIAGRHTFHFGAEYQRQLSDALFDLFGSGTIFTTEDFATHVRSGHAGPPDDRDIPIGLVIRSGAPVRPPFVPDINNHYVGGYIQDDWRVRSNLTFNIGLRWEWDNDIFGIDQFHGPCPSLFTTPSVPCVWLANVLDLRRRPDYNNFGPRFGFAWDPLKKGTTVIRGGYGLYYDRVVLEVPLLERLLDDRIISLSVLGGSLCNIPLDPTPPTSAKCSAANSVFATGTPTLANSPPFTGTPAAAGVGINILDKNTRHPRVHQFTLGIQRQIGPNWIVSADGIHNFGNSLLIGHLLRAPGGPNSSLTIAVPRPGGGTVTVLNCPTNNVPCTATDPLTGNSDNITNVEPSAKTWYDGLLVSVQRRPTRFDLFGRSLSWGFNVNYTLSKTLNYSNDDQIPFNGAEDQVSLALGINNLRVEKGYAPTDERHRLVFFGVFELPWAFTLSPIWTYSSSVPADSFVPDIPLIGGATGSRLPIIPRNALGRDIKTGADLNRAIANWEALPPCPAPAPCHVGPRLRRVPDNLEFGDPFNSFDMRLSKKLTLREKHHFELTGEVINLFNITNIRGKNNNNYSGRTTSVPSDPNPLGSAIPPLVFAGYYQPVRTAGGFFGSGGARAFQFAVKYSF